MTTARQKRAYDNNAFQPQAAGIKGACGDCEHWIVGVIVPSLTSPTHYHGGECPILGIEPCVSCGCRHFVAASAHERAERRRDELHQP